MNVTDLQLTVDRLRAVLMLPETQTVIENIKQSLTEQAAAFGITLTGFEVSFSGNQITVVPQGPYLGDYEALLASPNSYATPSSLDNRITAEETINGIRFYGAYLIWNYWPEEDKALLFALGKIVTTQADSTSIACE